MEPTNYPFRKENDLPNLHGDMFHVNLPGCISFSGHHVSRIFHLQNFDGKVAPEKDLAEKLQQQQMDLDALSGIVGKNKWGFPKIGVSPKWMVYNGKPH